MCFAPVLMRVSFVAPFCIERRCFARQLRGVWRGVDMADRAGRPAPLGFRPNGRQGFDCSCGIGQPEDRVVLESRAVVAVTHDALGYLGGNAGAGQIRAQRRCIA